MLRALGVLFIVCSCFVVGLVGIGVGWICLETGVVSLGWPESGPVAESATPGDTSLHATEAPTLAAPLVVSPTATEPSVIRQVAGDAVSTPRLLAAAIGDDGVNKARLLAVRVGNLQWDITPTGEIAGASEDTSILGLPRAAIDSDGIVLLVSGQRDLPANNVEANLTLPAASPIKPDVNDSNESKDIRQATFATTDLREGSFSFNSETVANPITIVIPPASVAGVTTVSHRSAGRYRDPDTVPAVGTAVTTYDSFLRVRFDQPAAVTGIEFAVFRVESDSQRVFVGNLRSTQFAPPAATIRDLELALPDGVAVGEIYVVSKTSNAHTFSTPLRYQRTTPLASGLVSVSAAAVSSTATLHQGAYYTNQDTVSLSANVSAPAAAEDLVLVAFARGSSGQLGRVNVPPNQNGALTINGVNLASDGSNTILLQVFQGNRAVSQAAAVDLMLLRTGPTVQTVDSFNFSFTPQGSQITVVFDSRHPLSRTSAENEANYSLAGNAPSEANLDETRNAVTLTFSDPGPGRHKLRILSGTAKPKVVDEESEDDAADGEADQTATPADGIQDLAGNRLNATPGNTGSPAEFEVFKPVGAKLPSEMRGIVGSTGPYVTFEEYTKPRQIVEGFNPSDKVITRVARLYYFRDAHRVTQIVNRKAASYGRQAVDMQQQLADAAQGAYDETYLRRRELERQAVEAARSARAAEEALQEQQQALTAARAHHAGIAAQHEQMRLEYAEQIDTRDDLQEKLNAAEADLKEASGSLPGQQTSLADAQTALTQRIAELDQLRADGASPEAIAIKTDEVNAARQLMGQRQNAVSATQSRIAAARTTIETTRGPLEVANDQVRTQAAANASAELAVQNAQAQVDAIEINVRNLLAEVQTKRESEITKTEAWDAAEDREQLAARDHFLREVAARHEDPDTFAPGYPQSNDPVEQVSISVVGEGLIQLRGPRKGVNIVHKMIHELDAPVGQVRVAVHTVQINGEHGDRMERVAMRIQRYIDHSRFLTTQSAQMLRNAVVTVAARKAQQCVGELPPASPQELRDRKYQESFFGQEFIDELADMDSEFLITGNKVLSLHAMDTTSLSNALFLLALAKNDTRQEILAEFMAQVQCKLPQDEIEYFQASGAEFKFRHQEFQFLGHNANFVSFRGFFDAHVDGPDTLNPLQREFIRLAQIFKSRLITEVELRQRVMERSLIEERIGTDYLAMLERARQEEHAAQEKLRTTVTQRQEQQKALSQGFSQLVANVDQLLDIDLPLQFLNRRQRDAAKEELLWRRKYDEQRSEAAPTLPMETEAANANRIVSRIGMNSEVEIQGIRIPFRFEGSGGIECRRAEIIADDSSAHSKTELEHLWRDEFHRSAMQLQTFLDFVAQVNLSPTHRSTVQKESEFFGNMVDGERQTASSINEVDPFNLKNLFIISIAADELAPVDEHVDQTIFSYVNHANQIAASLADRDFDATAALKDWMRLQADVLDELKPGEFKRRVNNWFEPIETNFRNLLGAEIEVKFAQDTADKARRPLDHKKFLDMLIDDVEEKYIELIDGTRAHTSNIDNYLARLATALEDDFNTQFYYPAFRYVRETSYYWDVQVGQIQTESILTNNREFAKVSPQATMEFDLPKRNILINEAFEGALAAYNDYGALIGDPNFLALARMYGGPSTGSTFGGGLPAPQVRDVLPGLPSQTDEQYLSQAENNVPRIGANLEALIPDPAIYKFETGTGFEIRPVIGPDGQSVVFHLQYMYTTNIREPVRADEKHLGRVKRHFIDTDVTMGNYELREVSRYQVALKASRTSRGVPGLEDIPGLGILFRPLPSQESSLQQNLILAQTVIYPTLFDLMGLRWAPAVADLDSLSLREREFVYRNREKFLRNEVFDYSSLQVDDFMRIPEAERRADLYRTQETIPYVHPNSYSGSGLNRQRSTLQEGYDPRHVRPDSRFIPEHNGDSGEFQVLPPPVFQDPPAGSGNNKVIPMSAPAPTFNEPAQLPRLETSRPVSAQEPEESGRNWFGWMQRMNPGMGTETVPVHDNTKPADDGVIVPIEHQQPSESERAFSRFRNLFRR